MQTIFIVDPRARHSRLSVLVDRKIVFPRETRSLETRSECAVRARRVGAFATCVSPDGSSSAGSTPTVPRTRQACSGVQLPEEAAAISVDRRSVGRCAVYFRSGLRPRGDKRLVRSSDNRITLAATDEFPRRARRAIFAPEVRREPRALSSVSPSSGLRCPRSLIQISK